MNFTQALNEWLVRASEIASGYNLTIDPGGRKYIRIVSEHKLYGGQRSAFCFVEKSTGNVLKCAGWKTPAKHARGNIHKVGKEGVGEYGALYLR